MKSTQETAQNALKAVDRLLCEMIDEGYSKFVAVLSNELATRDHLLMIAALCPYIPTWDTRSREEVTEALINHHLADDMVISMLCNNGYFRIWMMITKAARAGERSLLKLIRRCRFVEERCLQEELAQAILDHPEATDDMVALMASCDKAPYAQSVALERLRSMSCE